MIDCDVVLVAIQVQKSPVFRRDGADVHSDLFVSVAQAVLGGTARAQGLYETLNLTVSRRVHPRVFFSNGEKISNKYSVIKDWIILIFRFRQASRQTREFVWQERESPESVATALETITSMSK